MSDRSDAFVSRWVSDNVQNQPGLEDYTEYVAELAIQLRSDAEAAGIDEDELEQTTGDVEEYLHARYEDVQDGDLGFHEAD